MTTLSRAERRKIVERFYEQVSEDTRIEPEWMRQHIEASVPELPEDPTPEQCDAWIELASMLGDPGFVANVRSSAKDVWDNHTFEPGAWERESKSIMLKAKEAIGRGEEPSSAAAMSLRRNGSRYRRGCWAASPIRISRNGCTANMPDMIRARAGIGNWSRS